MEISGIRPNPTVNLAASAIHQMSAPHCVPQASLQVYWCEMSLTCIRVYTVHVFQCVSMCGIICDAALATLG